MQVVVLIRVCFGFPFRPALGYFPPNPIQR